VTISSRRNRSTIQEVGPVAVTSLGCDGSLKPIPPSELIVRLQALLANRL
jgi:hypothetical protein